MNFNSLGTYFLMSNYIEVKFKKKSKEINSSSFQAWNQLSRLQRNLVYLLLMVSLLVCCWNINRLKGHSSNASDSSLQSNVDKLLHDRTKEIDDEVKIRRLRIP